MTTRSAPKPTPTTETISTTAIYCRISEDAERDRKGIDRQLADCTELAARQGWKLAADPFIDNDLSAFSGKRRPAYQALLAKVRTGQIRRIVVYHMDRLYRQPRELEDLIDLAEAGKLEVACVSGSRYDLSDSDGQLNARMLVSVARKSSQDSARRQRRKQQELRDAGLYTGGRRPFGWRLGPEKGVLVPHSSEAKILRAAMDRMLAGASLNDVAREWTAVGVHTRRWSSSDVSAVLTMPRHAGLVVHKGAVLDQPAKWKPLVPRERWEQVCAVVNGRARNVGVPRRRSMLTAIATCGACGAPMVRSSGVKRIKLWRCDKSRGGCGRVSVRAELLEPIVVEATLQYVDTLDLAALLASENPDRVDHASTSKELAELDRREDDAAASFGAGRITVRAMEKITRDLEAQRKELRDRLAREVERDALSPFAGRPGALRASWPSLTTDQRRTVISEALGKVTILPTGKAGPRFDPSRIVIGTSPSSKTKTRKKAIGTFLGTA